MSKNKKSTTPKSNSRPWALIVILALALILRLGYLSQVAQESDFSNPYIDAAYHNVLARGMAFGDWTLPPEVNDPHFQTTPYFRGPGYPFLLALMYKFSGGSYWAPRIFQIGLGLLNLLLVFRLGRRLFSERAGLIAAALMATYWGMIYFEAELLAPIPVISVLLLLLHYSLDLEKRTRFRDFLVLGLLFGFGALLRANILLCVPIFLVWFWVLAQKKWPVGLRFLAPFGLGAALVILPVTWRNYAVSGEWVLISSNSGINLYIGNNPEADGYSAVIPDLNTLTGLEGWNSFDYDLIVQKLSLHEGRNLTHTQVSQFFSKKAKEFIFQNPGAFVKLCFRRLGLMIGPAEPHNNKMLELEREYHWILRYLPRFSLVFALSLFGVALWIYDTRRLKRSWLENRGMWLMFAWIFLYGGSYLPFFVTGRFRMPLLPFLMLIAGFGVDRALVLFRENRAIFFKAALPLMALFFAFALIRWVPYKADVPYWHYLRGSRFENQGKVQQAIDEFQKALSLNANQSDALTKLGIIRYRQGQVGEAQKLWERSIKVKPRQAQVLNNLAWTLAQQPNPTAEDLQA
ncbi:MAG: glycosyltransferase family 39 protein, partial [Acidobacteria bacterium]|nr:glycosyltransferase family 39 protein [Acidobacteriota bacterium]